VAYSEIEPFPSAVLAHHYPDTPNLGDMTKYREWDSGIGAIDVLAGGTPCQSFSIAGLRKGLEDPRGNLMLTYLAIAERFKPRWIVWENVPGVLSSNRGRDFGTFLGALAKLGYGWAYRVLDAQWFGLAQRRRRVFVVGCLGDTSRPSKVLFECESVCRDTPPDRVTQQSLAKCLTSRVGGGGFDAETETAIVERIEYCADVAGTLAAVDGPRGVGDQYSRKGKLVATLYMSSGQKDAEITKEISPALTCLHEAPIVKCFYPSDARKRGTITLHDQVKTLTSQGKQGDSEPCVIRKPSMGVRRLTPRECERLQGFPDDYTAIPWRRKLADQCPDGPRYKALGNSMAVPVMQWIGKRIEEEARDD
jgi:DNA (cytosine-5)-methyltransferase 1